MIKKLLAIGGLTSFAVFANATTYEFTAVITSVNGPDVPYIVGDSVTVAVEVDLSAPGYITSIYGGAPNYLPAGYYAAEYLYGDAVPNVNWDGWEEHYYYDNGATGSIFVLNSLAVSVPLGSGGIESWDSGTAINISQEWHSEGGAVNGFYAEGVGVVSSDMTPVNVPFLPLGALGALGVMIAVIRYRRKQ